MGESFLAVRGRREALCQQTGNRPLLSERAFFAKDEECAESSKKLKGNEAPLLEQEC